MPYRIHQVTRDGISPGSEKTTTVCRWDTLCDKKEVQKFLGICSWWQKLIPHYTEIAKPLYQLLEKAEFEWSSQEETAFTTVKKCLITAPVLVHPDPDKKFLIKTDASDIAIVGVLLQEDTPDVLCPIAYISRALSKQERVYSTYDREAIAIQDTIQHFRHYLLWQTLCVADRQQTPDPFTRNEGSIRPTWEATQ